MGSAALHSETILTVGDRAKTTTDHILPDLEGATFADRLQTIIAQDSVRVTDGVYAWIYSLPFAVIAYAAGGSVVGTSRRATPIR